MKRARIGVVGCGSVSQRVYIPRIAGMNGDKVDFVAVCDVVKERAKEAAEKFHPQQVYYDFNEMLEKADIDAVFNLTQIFSHMPINAASLRAGKHVFAEKPAAPTVGEMNELIAEARENRVKFACAPVFMLNPAIIEGRNLISRGIIGKICFARAHGSHGGIENIHGWPTDSTWFLRKGAGPLFDLGVYPLTVITGILGPAKRVSAFSGIALPERYVRGGVTKGVTFKTEAHDNTVLLLDFGESTFAAVDSNFCSKAVKGPEYEFYGSGGVLTFDRTAGANFWYEGYIDSDDASQSGWISSKLHPFESWRITLPTARAEWAKWYIDAGVDHFVECILEDKEPIPSAEHHRHVVEIVTKTYQAAETGKTQDLTTTF